MKVLRDQHHKSNYLHTQLRLFPASPTTIFREYPIPQFSNVPAFKRLKFLITSLPSHFLLIMSLSPLMLFLSLLFPIWSCSRISETFSQQSAIKYADISTDAPPCRVGGGPAFPPALGDCVLNCSVYNLGQTRPGQPHGCRLSSSSLNRHCSEEEGYSNMHCDRVGSPDDCDGGNWLNEQHCGVKCKCNDGTCRVDDGSKSCVAPDSEAWKQYVATEMENRRVALRAKYR